jgi:pimeloyl-ACP methyl ester carboxylesterase
VEGPNTGRAAFDVDGINLAATGQSPPLGSAPFQRNDSQTWVGFGMGPEFGVLAPNGQMSTEPEDLRRFLAAVGAPRKQPAYSFDATGAVFTEVLEETGPAIWIGWSSAGTNAQAFVVDRPDLFRALITLEPGAAPCSGGPPPPPLVNALVDNGIPYLNINSTVSPRCQELVDGINAAGGDATQINLPDIGISGNSHMMFFEKNSDDIAKVITDWIKAHVK